MNIKVVAKIERIRIKTVINNTDFFCVLVRVVKVVKFVVVTDTSFHLYILSTLCR